jgi:hypothetical protein
LHALNGEPPVLRYFVHSISTITSNNHGQHA